MNNLFNEICSIFHDNIMEPTGDIISNTKVEDPDGLWFLDFYNPDVEFQGYMNDEIEESFYGK